MIPYYIVTISSNEDTNVMASVNVFYADSDDDMLTYTFNNLRSGTTYDITISAANRAGAGMPTTISDTTIAGTYITTEL